MLARRLRRLVPAIVLAAAPAGAQVVNGGFEAPPAASSIETRTSIPGWTASSGNFELITSGHWQPHSGNQSIDLNGTQVGSIYQDLVTQAGATYELSFWMAGNPGTSEDKTMNFFWNGGIVGQVTFIQAGTSTANMGWRLFGSGNLVATSTTTRLEFQSTSPNAFSGPALDDVAVTLVAGPPGMSNVPEPSTYALFATGLLGLAGVARRRRTS